MATDGNNPTLNRPTKITVRPQRVRGTLYWRVRFRDAVSLKIARRFFDSKTDADKFALKLTTQNRDADAAWAMLNATEKSNLLAVWREARKRDVDLMAAVMAQAERSLGAQKDLGTVIEEMTAAKRKAGRNSGYVDDLELMLKRFAAGREAKAIGDVGSDMVSGFLELLPAGSRLTARARLSTLFNYAVRHGYRADNPCARLERQRLVKKLPAVMTPAEATKAIGWLVTNPVHHNVPKKFKPARGAAHPALAWFILTTFAGLRPEEAMLVNGNELRETLSAKPKPFVEVKPEATKTGAWRIVYPRPEVVVALRWALAHGSVLPLDQWRKQRTQQRLAKVLGWERWPQDITRRSAASYWLALTNDLKLMVEMLGNSEAIFKRHYKKPVPVDQAKEFFAAVLKCGGNG